MSVCFPVGTHGVYQGHLRSLAEWKSLPGISRAAGLEGGWQLRGRGPGMRARGLSGRPWRPSWGPAAPNGSVALVDWCLGACVYKGPEGPLRPVAMGCCLQHCALHGNQGSYLHVQEHKPSVVPSRSTVRDGCPTGQRGRQIPSVKGDDNFQGATWLDQCAQGWMRCQAGFPERRGWECAHPRSLRSEVSLSTAWCWPLIPGIPGMGRRKWL